MSKHRIFYNLVIRKMKIIALAVFSLLLISCSNKPDLNLIIDEVLGYELGNRYQVIDYTQSPEFLDYFGKYNGSYAIQLNEQEYFGLISNTKGSWKLQPTSRNDYKRWERIAQIKSYGLISVSSFDTNSRIINVHISE